MARRCYLRDSFWGACLCVVSGGRVERGRCDVGAVGLSSLGSEISFCKCSSRAEIV